ncbi:MAG TPA: acyl-CoA dehydrogenase, partial [Alphaproteobacteria bacterium]|nr:acyl-CoA dehydrogenase [Alphaproteobacteria bacterium]
MDFEYSEHVRELQFRLRDFMDRYVVPHIPQWHREVKAGQRHPQVVQDLKALAKDEGLWNLFLPGLRDDEP